MMEMFYILNVVVSTWVYTLNSLNCALEMGAFIVCKLYLKRKQNQDPDAETRALRTAWRAE